MEKKGVGRPRDGNPEETRRQILDAAARAFAESGFVGATTRAVAARAGVNVATLHYHYGSKEGLYRAVLAHTSRGTLPELPAGSGEGAVAALVEALFAFGSERPTLARLALLDVLAGPGGGSPDERVRWLADHLRPSLATAGGEPAPAEEAARAIVVFVDAAFVAAGARNGSQAAAVPLPQEEPAVPLPDAAARRAVVAAALRLTGLG
ncbi:MAG: TetR/AcrR family transcriptional regulator [Thermoanaerobaculia bacterium]